MAGRFAAGVDYVGTHRGSLGLGRKRVRNMKRQKDRRDAIVEEIGGTRRPMLEKTANAALKKLGLSRLQQKPGSGRKKRALKTAPASFLTIRR